MDLPCLFKAAAADRQTACSCQAWFTSMYACAALVCPACLRQRLLTAERRQPLVLLAHCHVRLRCIGGPDRHRSGAAGAPLFKGQHHPAPPRGGAAWLLSCLRGSITGLLEKQFPQPQFLAAEGVPAQYVDTRRLLARFLGH